MEVIEAQLSLMVEVYHVMPIQPLVIFTDTEGPSKQVH